MNFRKQMAKDDTSIVAAIAQHAYSKQLVETKVPRPIHAPPPGWVAYSPIGFRVIDDSTSPRETTIQGGSQPRPLTVTRNLNRPTRIRGKPNQPSPPIGTYHPVEWDSVRLTTSIACCQQGDENYIGKIENAVGLAEVGLIQTELEDARLIPQPRLARIWALSISNSNTNSGNRFVCHAKCPANREFSQMRSDPLKTQKPKKAKPKRSGPFRGQTLIQFPTVQVKWFFARRCVFWFSAICSH